jgi:limonene-1,2-epoxide hydrolase
MTQEQLTVKTNQNHSSPKAVIEQMIAALNRHDLEAMVACFGPEFRSEQPFHPERGFTGPGGVRQNWSFFFANIPDIQAEILNMAVEGTTVWTELHYHGTQLDGSSFCAKGVTLTNIEAGKISWARLYTEQVAEPPQA